MIGPILPTIILQKIAGFARAAHLVYCQGWLKKPTGAIAADQTVNGSIGKRLTPLNCSCWRSPRVRVNEVGK
jgi:hypothetical protein